MNKPIIGALALLAIAAVPLQARSASQVDPLHSRVQADLPGLMPIYRDLHQNPESSLQEHRSTKIMADAARAAGFAVTEGVGRTGVVAVLKNGAGRPMPARPAHLTRGR